MNIAEFTPHRDWKFSVVADDGRTGQSDVRPYLQFEAFEELKDIAEFMKIKNGGYFVEWDCGADLSADTIEAKMEVTDSQPYQGNGVNRPHLRKKLQIS